jgi:hypothetical protein
VRKRKAHGNAANGGATIVFEVPPTDELRPAPAGSAAPVERRGDGTVTPQGAAELARMRWEAERMPDFAERELDVVPADAFAPFDRARREYLSHRRQELHTATGGVSAGVGGTLRGEAWLVAIGEYYATVAATTLDGKAADRAARFLQSASIERAKAWDLATLEARARVDDEGADLRRQQAEFQRKLAARQRNGSAE